CKLVGLRGKVRLTVDFHNGAHAVLHNGADGALGGNAAGLLRSGSQALLPEPFHRLVHVAVGGSQSLLAVHHAHVGHLTQFLYICSSKCHSQNPPSIVLVPYFQKGRCSKRRERSPSFRLATAPCLNMLTRRQGPRERLPPQRRQEQRAPRCSSRPDGPPSR